MLAGGPGQSASALAPFAARLNEVRRKRDVILVDQRGTGRSSPLDCEAYSPAAMREADVRARSEAAREALRRRTRAAGRRRHAVHDRRVHRRPRGDPHRARRPALEPVGRQLRLARGARVRAAPSRPRPHDDPRRRRAARRWRSASTCGRSASERSTRCSSAAARRRPARRRCPIPARRSTRSRATSARPAARSPTSIPRPVASNACPAPPTARSRLLQPLLYGPETTAMIPALIERARGGDFGALAAAATAFTADLAEQMNTALHYSVTCAEDVPRIVAAERDRALDGMRSKRARAGGDRRVRGLAARQRTGGRRDAGRLADPRVALLRRPRPGDAARARRGSREDAREPQAHRRARLRAHRLAARLRAAARRRRSSTPAGSRSSTPTA